MPANITREQEQQQLEKNLKIASVTFAGLALATLIAIIETTKIYLLLTGIGAITLIAFPDETLEWIEDNPGIISGAAFGSMYGLPAILLFAIVGYSTQLYCNKGVSSLKYAKETGANFLFSTLASGMGKPFSWAANKVSRFFTANEEPETQPSGSESDEFLAFTPQKYIELTPYREAAMKQHPAKPTHNYVTPVSPEEMAALKKKLQLPTCG